MKISARYSAALATIALATGIATGAAFYVSAHDGSQSLLDMCPFASSGPTERISIPGGERRRHGENDAGHGRQADGRRRPRFRRHDGAASPGRHRHGRSDSALRPQRAAQAAGAGDHRHPATGDRGDATGRRRAPAAVRSPSPTQPSPRHRCSTQREQYAKNARHGA